MNVRELKALLDTLDENALVVLSSDSEGNSYSPAASHDLCEYQAETTWRGYVSHPDDEEPMPDTAVPALVLWPTN